MRERQKIVERWKRGDAAALITLVRVEGSSYRDTGARLIISANGDATGGISGGCLEAEVIRKAQWKVNSGAVVDRYSTEFDDTAEIPYGLGCGGVVDLLLEPAETLEFEALMQAMDAAQRGQMRRVLTQLPENGAGLARSVVDAQGEEIFRSSAGLWSEGGAIFEETLEPSQRLIIFGAGDDAQPMVQAASMLGWRTFVIDSRPQWARRERFPQAEQVLTALHELEISPKDAVVVMTHSYEQDRAWLMAMLPRQPRYLGLLGSRHRSALLLNEAAVALGWNVARVCEHIFAPIGLDLGGDGAEAIAFATVAEILACYEGKLENVPRRMTPEVIAQQIEQGGASRYLQTQCAL